MSVDLNEIAKFDALAKDWWDPLGPMKPLHQLNPLRFKAITQQVKLAGKKILDIGCGGGLLSETMAKAQAQVTGIDLSESLIKTASQHAQQQGLNIEYRLQSSTELVNEQREAFDIITCMELLEHVPDPDLLIQECAKLVKPDGMIFFATINRNWQSFLKAIVGAEYILKLLPRGTHQYSQFIRPSELTLWANRSGLSLKGFQGFSYNPLLQQFHLSEDISVNYLAFYTRQSGQNAIAS